MSALLDDHDLRFQDLNKALEIDPEDIDTLLMASMAYQHGRKNKDLQKSRELAERAIALAPNNPAAHERLAWILGWSEAAGSSPRGIFRIIGGDSESALRNFNRAIKLAPGQSAFIRSRGVYFSYIGEFDRAVDDLNWALESNPQDWRALRGRADVNFARGDLDAALLDLRASVQLRPNDAESYRRIAEVALKKKNWEEAAAACTRAITIEPSYAWSYKRRAVARFELGRYDECLEDLRATFERDPNDNSIHVWIKAGRVAACQDKAFQDGLIELANQVVERNRTAFALYGRALLLLAMDRKDQALADYEEATKLDPERQSLRNYASGAKLLELVESAAQDTEGRRPN
jgi:tetratricopeptide (TPR) repeat protein